MAHTPGPWEVRNDFYIGRKGRLTLAEVKCGDAPSEDIETHKANARLIAAAPELLACVEVWLEQMRQEMAPQHSVQFRMASEAIAKTKGA